MGCDIHGWVEIRSLGWCPEAWERAIYIGSIVRRNYWMFGLLFGVRNRYVQFDSIALERGLPEDVSYEVEEDFLSWGQDAHSPSYITWREIERINWNMWGKGLVKEVICTAQGEVLPFDEKRWHKELTWEERERVQKGEAVEKSGVIYKMRTIQAKEVLTSDWDLLFRLMKEIEDHYQREAPFTREYNEHLAIHTIQDGSRARLVVWFDN